MEKPLKLVLKVGGNEVAELSTQSSIHDSALYDDKSEHEKHKDKKRKKRKKAEKLVPGEEKEKRKRKVKVSLTAVFFYFSLSNDLPLLQWSLGIFASHFN